MISPKDQKRVLQQLSSVFFHAGQDQLSKELSSFHHVDHELVSLLTKIERSAGLPTDLWRMVVRAKGVLAGKVRASEFTVETLKYQGLI